MNPRRLTPSMSLLVAFEAAARHLSFTRAAAELAQGTRRHHVTMRIDLAVIRKQDRQAGMYGAVLEGIVQQDRLQRRIIFQQALNAVHAFGIHGHAHIAVRALELHRLVAHFGCGRLCIRHPEAFGCTAIAAA